MRSTHLFVILTIVLAAQSIHAAATWPQFRGLSGDGISDAKNLPLTWSDSENVKWKTPVHGKAWSSPVVWGNQVWMTTATPDGRELYAVCLDRESGKVVYDEKLFDIAQPQFCIAFNSYASPTPCIEEGRVYVTFGAPGTACLDTATGKVLWTRTDFVCNHFRGPGSSPTLYKNLMIMNYDGSDFQFVAALDKETGRTSWQTERDVDYGDIEPNGKPRAEGDFRKAFSTPRIATFDGHDVLVSLGSKALYGYEPLTGKELWRVEDKSSFSGSDTPVFGNGMIFYGSGHGQSELLAVRPTGSGNITDSAIVWRLHKKVPTRSSVLFVKDHAQSASDPVGSALRTDSSSAGAPVRSADPTKVAEGQSDGLIYMVTDAGIVNCVDAKTGEEVWHGRIDGTYSASPIYADGRIYFFSESGKTSVLAPGREFKVLGENQLPDGIMATPAIAGDAIFLRTKTSVYRIQK